MKVRATPNVNIVRPKDIVLEMSEGSEDSEDGEELVFDEALEEGEPDGTDQESTMMEILVTFIVSLWFSFPKFGEAEKLKENSHTQLIGFKS